MLKLWEFFNPRANNATTNYPYGSIKDESVPDANDGTPLSAAWANDYEGFSAALLAEAQMVPSGNADTAIASQRLAAIKALIEAIKGTNGTDVRTNSQNDVRFVQGNAGTGATDTRTNAQNDTHFVQGQGGIAGNQFQTNAQNRAEFAPKISNRAQQEAIGIYSGTDSDMPTGWSFTSLADVGRVRLTHNMTLNTLDGFSITVMPETTCANVVLGARTPTTVEMTWYGFDGQPTNTGKGLCRFQVINHEI